MRDREGSGRGGVRKSNQVEEGSVRGKEGLGREVIPTGVVEGERVLSRVGRLDFIQRAVEGMQQSGEPASQAAIVDAVKEEDLPCNKNTNNMNKTTRYIHYQT